MSAARSAASAAAAVTEDSSARAGGQPAALFGIGPRPHRVFILPTRQGFGFAVVLLAMLIGAANYNNSLAYILTFLLGSLALVSMLHTHRNLAGLKIGVAATRSVFCGTSARFHLTLDNRGHRARHGLVMRWAGGPAEAKAPASVRELSLDADAVVKQVLESQAARRGWQPLGRVILATRFPFGLFRAWCPLDIATECLVYPQPKGDQPLPRSTAESVRESGIKGIGRDDFSGFRDYVPGDSPRQIHWKAAARYEGLPVKLFSGANAGDVMLYWSDVAVAEVEARLSQLSRWVVDAEAGEFRYGLSIPGATLAPAQGEAHRHACLKALALYAGDGRG